MTALNDIITLLHHSYNGGGYGGGGGWYGFIQSPALGCDPETVTTAIEIVTSLG